jgi:hypothetical protein
MIKYVVGWIDEIIRWSDNQVTDAGYPWEISNLAKYGSELAVANWEPKVVRSA